MKYVVLDLEWNQTYHEKALAVQRELESRLRGEVIQIGAVMLDENKNLCGSFCVTVKPRFYKKIHRHVMRLTGIDQKQLDNGLPLREAMSAFYRFCGDDSVFLTWGPDDIPMLCDNLPIGLTRPGSLATTICSRCSTLIRTGLKESSAPWNTQWSILKLSRPFPRTTP